MAVLFSEDKTEIIVTCNCGCEDSIHIKVYNDDKDDDYYAFWSYMNGRFYTDQNNIVRTIFNKIRKIWSIIRNKDYYYSDVVMNKKEFDKIKEYINQF